MIIKLTLLILCVIMVVDMLFKVVYMLVSFLTEIYRKRKVFLIRKSKKFVKSRVEIEKFHIIRFYNTFGFYYEDLIKYAPGLDELLSSKIRPELKDRVAFKMMKMHEIYDAIRTVEEIDIIKFKQTIENIKNQKALENID